MEIYDRYREFMERDHFFDYEELIYRTIQMLEDNSNLLDGVKQRYKHFVVDEYQDIDRAHERLIDLLAGDSGTLCVVGDDDQSIYRWRGGRPEIFLGFEDKFNAEIVRLEENFRSTRPVVDIADHVISKNREREEKELICGIDGDIGDVYQLYFEDESEETRFIREKISSLLGTSYDDGRGHERTLGFGDIAVLFRRKRDMAQLIEEFEKSDDIPFTAKGQATLFSRPETELVRFSFAYIARGQHLNITITDSENGRFVVEESDLRNLIRSSNLLRKREDVIIKGLRTMRGWYEAPTSRRIIPQIEFQKILELMGASEVEFPEPIMYELGQISKILKNFETVYRLVFPNQIRDLVEFLNWASEKAESEIDDPTMLNVVNLMTIHGAKGTEFPIVFVPGLTTRKFPKAGHSFIRHWGGVKYIPEDIFDYSDYDEGEEDARRLFYVAITRSRKYVFLTGARRNTGYERRQNPSLFFNEVAEVENPCIVRERIADPTPRRPGTTEGVSGEMVYPTSYVDLRYYLRCPNDYRMRRIFGFCPPVGSGFGYGFAVHNILREIHERFQEDEESILPSAGEIKEMVEDPQKFFLRYSAGSGQET
jgi:DNA helicase-2/ATP-dependent DNA helicase PcrA